MTSLTRAEAFVGVAMCAAFADGTMEADEADELAEVLQDCNALRSVGEPEIRAAILRVDEVSRKEGDKALLAQAAAALSPELRATAFYLAVDLVSADDELAPEERAFLRELQGALGVPEKTAADIVHVVAVFKRG